MDDRWPSAAPGGGDWPQCLFVEAIWLAMSAAALLLAAGCGSLVPYFDDWENIPVLCGKEPTTWHWLWQPANEHRVPVTKALMWVAYRASGGDLRWLMYVSVVVTSATAIGLTLFARRLRGRMSYLDAFFPLLLLHGGHADSFLLWGQICQIAPACAFLVVIMYLARDTDKPPRLWFTLLAAICLVLLPLHSATGMAFALVATPAVARLGWQAFRRPLPAARTEGAVLLSAAVATAGLIGVYLACYQPIAGHQAFQASAAEMACAAVRCAGMAFGVVGYLPWCLSGVAVLVLSLVSAIFLLQAAIRWPHERQRALRLLLALVAAWTLAVAIGVGRAKFGGVALRYSLLTAPILCCVYFSCLLYGSRSLGRLVLVSLFTALCALSSYHAKIGLDWGIERRQATERFFADVDRGIPLTGLAGRHWFAWHVTEPAMADGLRMLREAGVGDFRRIALDPPFRVLSVYPTADASIAAIPSVAAAGADAVREHAFTLKSPRPVYAVRVRLAVNDNARDARFELQWNEANESASASDHAAGFDYRIRTGALPITHTLWIDRPIDGFRLRLGTPPLAVQSPERSLLRGRPGGAASQIQLQTVEILCQPDR